MEMIVETTQVMKINDNENMTAMKRKGIPQV